KMAAGQGGYGAPTSPPPAPPSGGGSKKIWLLGGGVAVLAVVAVIALVLALTSGGDEGDKGKSAPTAAAKDLLLPESGFPSAAGGEFSVSDGSGDGDDDDIKVDNEACNRIVNAEDKNNGSQKASRELKISESGTSSFSETTYEAELTKPVDKSDLDTFDETVSNCTDFTMTIDQDGTPVTAKMKMSKSSIPGVDGKYKAAKVTGTFEISGIKVNFIMHVVLGVEREVGIEITHGLVSTGNQAASGVESDLASMFNQQRELIANAS
ncbi:MAG TPA: hypothetical protein PLC22_09095, partial [Gordonia sp. (in: high G+C Gram-positive bacteria)]|nr:hypothetical protein [Gordonia sp. (in: high G+C Gram-positive bacteria)]